MDRVYLEVPSVGEVLQKYVKDYRRKHQRLSSAQVARRFGLSTSTLNRIELGDIRTPAVDQAIKILKGCADAEAVTDFMRTYYPDIHESLITFLKQTSDSVEIEEDCLKYFSDETTYLMMLFATTRAGLRENWVLQEYGRSGHSKFMKLAARGVLVNRNDRFYAAEKGIVRIGQEAALKTLEFIAKQANEEIKVKKELIGTRFSVEYCSVNYEKIGKVLTDLNSDYIADVRALLNKEDNVGADLVYVGSLMKLIKDIR